MRQAWRDPRAATAGCCDGTAPLGRRRGCARRCRVQYHRRRSRDKVEDGDAGCEPRDARVVQDLTLTGMAADVLRIGIAGLGRAFAIMLPTLRAHPRVEVVAAADPREAARRRFAADFGGAAYATVDELCADPRVDVVYVASPHALHAAHASAAARAGKHVLVEKPMALTLADCDAMVDAAGAAGVCLIVGHSHSFDAPVARARALIASGAYGRVRMITALNFTDYLYRPRRPEELDTAQRRRRHLQPGGAPGRRRAHAGRQHAPASVRAASGAWDAARPTEGAYTAFMTFDDGVARVADLQRLCAFRQRRVLRLDRRAGTAGRTARATARHARRWPRHPRPMRSSRSRPRAITAARRRTRRRCACAGRA